MRLYAIIGFVVLLCVGVSTPQASAQGMQISAEDRTHRLKDSLSLSDEQTASVLRIYQEMDNQRKELFSSGSSGDRQARMDAMRSLMEKTDTRIEALLTTEQKTKYEQMKKERQQRRQGFQRKVD